MASGVHTRTHAYISVMKVISRKRAPACSRRVPGLKMALKVTKLAAELYQKLNVIRSTINVEDIILF